MIQIFGLFFIILICLIYLHYQGKISKNIPIIYMFFLILIIPFQYLEKNNINKENFYGYDQIMNSSLDIYYTNQKKENKKINHLKKFPLIYNPINASIVKKNYKPIELYLYAQAETSNGLYIIYNSRWYEIYTTYNISQNLFTYMIASDFEDIKNLKNNVTSRIQRFNNLTELKTFIDNSPVSSYIIININKLGPIHSSDLSIKNTFINTYRFSNWINSNPLGSLVIVLAKSYDNNYINIVEKNVSRYNFLNFYQIIKIDENQVVTNGGEVFEEIETNDVIQSISNEPLINYKINIISPALLNQNYSLSITVENNESFVYLSSRKLEDEIALYSKSPKKILDLLVIHI